MTKVEITGASNWVRRMFEACGPHQWARELLKNSLEAKATRVVRSAAPRKDTERVTPLVAEAFDLVLDKFRRPETRLAKLCPSIEEWDRARLSCARSHSWSNNTSMFFIV